MFSSLWQVTLDTNQAAAVSLPALFPEFSWDGPPNALGFQLLCGSTVTIVASKYSGQDCSKKEREWGEGERRMNCMKQVLNGNAFH